MGVNVTTENLAGYRDSLKRIDALQGTAFPQIIDALRRDFDVIESSYDRLRSRISSLPMEVPRSEYNRAFAQIDAACRALGEVARKLKSMMSGEGGSGAPNSANVIMCARINCAIEALNRYLSSDIGKPSNNTQANFSALQVHLEIVRGEIEDELSQRQTRTRPAAEHDLGRER